MVLRDLIVRLLKEVDLDIGEMMMSVNGDGYEAWTLMPDPMNTILSWQEMRERRNHEHRT